MTIHFEDPRAAAADIAYRRRALKTNAGIYARRHRPRLLPLLSDSNALRTAYIRQMDWLGSEHDWRPDDARRISALASDISRFGNLRPPAAAEECQWHADRLRELVRQHGTLAQLEREYRPAATWTIAARSKGRRRGGPPRQKVRGFLA